MTTLSYDTSILDDETVMLLVELIMPDLKQFALNCGATVAYSKIHSYVTTLIENKIEQWDEEGGWIKSAGAIALLLVEDDIVNYVDNLVIELCAEYGIEVYY
ncbi:MAG: hypothetical protein IJ740_20050 [Ruminococcus sp.]|nr:hypothetical protein [Ruminococcus sp.]